MCRFFLYYGKNKLVSEILDGDNPIYKQFNKKAYTPNSSYWIGSENFIFMGLGILIPNNNIIKFTNSNININNDLLNKNTNILLAHLRLYDPIYNKKFIESEIQPLIYNNIIFMHVGTLFMNNIPNHPPKIIEDKIRKYMSTDTDSSYMFSLFLYHYNNNLQEEIINRLIKAFIYMVKIIIENSNKHISGSMNFLIYGNDFILCSRLTTKKHGISSPIYYTTLNNDIMISLEPTNTVLDWIEIPQQHILLYYKNKVLIHNIKNYSIIK